MKKIVIAFMMSCLCLINISDASATSTSSLYSKYVYVYDATSSQILKDTQSTVKMYPASMTKMMTVYCALQKITNLDATVTITTEDITGWLAKDASVAGFTAGETVTYRDLLYACLLPSGADACYCLARVLYGNEANMATAMNRLAKKIGMTHSHFVNTSGLHNANHYTTCRDLVTLMIKAT